MEGRKEGREEGRPRDWRLGSELRGHQGGIPGRSVVGFCPQ